MLCRKTSFPAHKRRSCATLRYYGTPEPQYNNNHTFLLPLFYAKASDNYNFVTVRQRGARAGDGACYAVAEGNKGRA